jgi:hypothetical protein
MEEQEIKQNGKGERRKTKRWRRNRRLMNVRIGQNSKKWRNRRREDREKGEKEEYD